MVRGLLGIVFPSSSRPLAFPRGSLTTRCLDFFFSLGFAPPSPCAFSQFLRRDSIAVSWQPAVDPSHGPSDAASRQPTAYPSPHPSNVSIRNASIILCVCHSTSHRCRYCRYIIRIHQHVYWNLSSASIRIAHRLSGGTANKFPNEPPHFSGETKSCFFIRTTLLFVVYSTLAGIHLSRFVLAQPTSNPRYL